MHNIDPNMTVFGEHDENTLEQLRDIASRAERAALMGDGHLGYHMPVGGVAAYRDKVSVGGVGFDIACIAEGSLVPTDQRVSIPIEMVSPAFGVLGWDGEQVREVYPHLGSVTKGEKECIVIILANGREVVCTPDHRIRTAEGWKEACEIMATDKVACPIFVGREAEFGRRPGGASPALARILGYLAGNGHLTKQGNRLCFYMYDGVHDVQPLVDDLQSLGLQPKIHSRKRDGCNEHCVYFNDKDFRGRVEFFGIPVGKKVWSYDACSKLLDLPGHLLANLLSGFLSADGSAPVMSVGSSKNVYINQVQDTDDAIRIWKKVLEHLGFKSNLVIADSGSGRTSYVTQVLGGSSEFVRLMAEVGYCYSSSKQQAGENAVQRIWDAWSYTDERSKAREYALQVHDKTGSLADAIEKVTKLFDVSRSFVSHSIYSQRGAPRLHPKAMPDVWNTVIGGVGWSHVVDVGSVGKRRVFDIVSEDSSESFIAGGVVVHNCGNAAIRTDLTLNDLVPYTLDNFKANPHAIQGNGHLNRLADAIFDELSFGIGRKNLSDDAPVDDPLFRNDAWYLIPNEGGYRDTLRAKAREQLGTIGSGNHYVDVFVDETGHIWVGVHFGSRGFGHTIATNFLALSAGKRWGERVKEHEGLLELNTTLGDDYWHLMNLAGQYAYVGREWVARKVVSMLGGKEIELVHNHHNFAWREHHIGEEFVVVRKGATPAFPGQKGFVGGSMGDDAVILQGRNQAEENDDAVFVSEYQLEALFSTVHGAGRVMSRTAAKGKWKKGQMVRRGAVSHQDMHEWLDRRGVILRGADLDEAPQAYRRLDDVLDAQGPTIEVLHRLRPIIVCMAPGNTQDPYRD